MDIATLRQAVDKLIILSQRLQQIEASIASGYLNEAGLAAQRQHLRSTNLSIKMTKAVIVNLL